MKERKKTTLHLLCIFADILEIKFCTNLFLSRSNNFYYCQKCKKTGKAWSTEWALLRLCMSTSMQVFGFLHKPVSVSFWLKLIVEHEELLALLAIHDHLSLLLPPSQIPLPLRQLPGSVCGETLPTHRQQTGGKKVVCLQVTVMKKKNKDRRFNIFVVALTNMQQNQRQEAKIRTPNPWQQNQQHSDQVKLNPSTKFAPVR